MRLPVIRFTFFLRLYDIWIGVRITDEGAIYVHPIPMFGVKIEVVRWEDV